jgi:hypothetical protein
MVQSAVVDEDLAEELIEDVGSGSHIMQSAAVKDTAQAKSVLATETHMAVPAASKRIHVRTESGSRALPPSPPRKKIAPMDVTFCSPDRDNLKVALRSGGTANVNVKKGKSGS